jgi:hypothetical protein
MIDEEIQKLLDLDVIEPSRTPWSSPLIVTRGEKPRVVVDFRRLNKLLKKAGFPIPTVEEILFLIGHAGARVFSVIDLRKGYYQLLVEEFSRELLGIMTPKGKFRFKRLPLGVVTAPAEFQARIQHVLEVAGIFGHGAVNYLDDIIVYSTDLESHLLLLRKLFAALDAADLKINSEKLQLCLEDVAILGYRVNSTGVYYDPAKLSALTTAKNPGHPISHLSLQLLVTAQWINDREDAR